MIEVDGSFGEGGGQLLRYSVALSAILGSPIKVYNIRAKRSNPGLRPQHMTAVKLIASIVDAEVEGLKVGSTSIIFKPKTPPKGGNYNMNIGTAGSISLVLQASLPVLTFATNTVTLRLIGGTSVRWSPPVPYLKEVLLPLLKKMGVKAEVRILKRGFYPQGGGLVEVQVEPVDFLSPIRLETFSEIREIKGISYCSNLPSHVAIRQANSAKEVLRKAGYENVEIEIDIKTPSPSRGSGIVLWALTDTGIAGGDAIGERGKRAEIVGQEAAEKLIKALRSKVPVDDHALDNLIIYMSLAKGESYIFARELTSHAKTAMKLCEDITGAKFSVEKEEDHIKIFCKGIGVTRKVK
jgi:RNA 3'-terminal phosphate cyclase (ATP)